MTDQRQSTRDQWAPPAPTQEQADPDWTGPASSSQNGAAKDWTDAERPAVDGTVYESAAHESAIDESVVDDISADEPVAEERAAAPPADDGDSTGGDDAVASDVTGSGELLPGDVPDEPGLALLDGDTTGRFRDRWHELQLRFVDDPHAAADQAGALVDEVVAALRDAVDGQRSALEEWQSGEGIDTHLGDTERLRVAVRRYRDFLDRLLGL